MIVKGPNPQTGTTLLDRIKYLGGFVKKRDSQKSRIKQKGRENYTQRDENRRRAILKSQRSSLRELMGIIEATDYILEEIDSGKSYGEVRERLGRIRQEAQRAFEGPSKRRGLETYIKSVYSGH